MAIDPERIKAITDDPEADLPDISEEQAEFVARLMSTVGVDLLPAPRASRS